MNRESVSARYGRVQKPCTYSVHLFLRVHYKCHLIWYSKVTTRTRHVHACVQWLRWNVYVGSTPFHLWTVHTHTHTHKTHTHTNTKRCSTTNSTFRDHTQLLRCYQSGQATAGQCATSTNTKTRHTHTNTHAQKLRRYCSLFFFWLSV